MERIKLILIFIVILFYGCNSKDNSVIVDHKHTVSVNNDLLSFLNDDKRIYINKECLYFLDAPLYKKYIKLNKVDDPPGKLKEIELIYNDSINITIILDEDYFSSSRKWDIEKIKSFKIKEINIFKEDQILQSTREK